MLFFGQIHQFATIIRIHITVLKTLCGIVSLLQWTVDVVLMLILKNKFCFIASFWNTLGRKINFFPSSHLAPKYTKMVAGHEIAPTAGANATKFFLIFHFGDQILKISRQIGEKNLH